MFHREIKKPVSLNKEYFYELLERKNTTRARQVMRN